MINYKQIHNIKGYILYIVYEMQDNGAEKTSINRFTCGSRFGQKIERCKKNMNQGDESKHKLLTKNFIHKECIIGLLIEIMSNIICMVHKYTSEQNSVYHLPEQLDVCILHKTYTGETQVENFPRNHLFIGTAISVTLTVLASTPLPSSLRYTHDSGSFKSDNYFLIRMIHYNSSGFIEGWIF